MGRDTRAGAKQEIWELLTTADIPLVDGIAHAYRCDPGPGSTGHPTFLSVASAGMDSDAYFVRVVVAAADGVNSEAAQDALDGLSQEIDILLTTRFGPGVWEDGHDDELEARTSTAVYGVPREDGLFRPGLLGGPE